MRHGSDRRGVIQLLGDSVIGIARVSRVLVGVPPTSRARANRTKWFGPRLSEAIGGTPMAGDRDGRDPLFHYPVMPKGCGGTVFPNFSHSSPSNHDDYEMVHLALAPAGPG